jgi:hypothetical protein
MATWNPSDSIGLTFSNGNLTATNTSGSSVWYTCRSTPSFQKANKVYAEFTATSAGVSGSAVYLAVMNSQAALNQPGTDGNSFGFNQDGTTLYNGSAGGTLAPWTTGDIICFAVDGNNNTLWVRVNNGNWNNNGTANPATNTGGIACSTIFAFGSIYFGTSIHTLNYAITGNFDGSFTFTVPSGFAAQPPVTQTAINQIIAVGQVATIQDTDLKAITSAVMTGSAGLVQPTTSAIQSIAASGLVGSPAGKDLTNAFFGVHGTSRIATIVTASATSVFNFEGFDHQAGQADLLHGAITSVLNCVSSLSFATPYAAGKALNITVPARTAGYAICNAGPQTLSSMTIGVMTQSNILSTIGTDIGLLNGTTPQIFARIMGGAILLYRGSPTGSSVLLRTLLNCVPATGWFFLELVVVIGPTGSVTIRVNGVTVATYSSINTSNDGSTSMNGVLLGGISSNTATDFLFDDLYVATSALGPTRVSTSVPAANGNQIQFLTSTGGANWQQLRESAMDSDASYNFTSTFGLSDQFALTALPGSTGTIFGLKVSMAARRDADNALSMSTLVVSNQAKIYGAITPLSNDYQYISSIYALDPSTGVSWTAGSVNAAQIGYGIVDATLASIATAPTLDLNFTQNSTLDGQITFARSSTATYFDAAGTLQVALSGAPRFDYGYLPNGSTNLLLQSGALSGSPWSARNSVAVTTGQLAFDGTSTAFLLSNPSTTAAIWDIFQDLPQGLTTIGIPYTASVYAKDAGNTWFHMQIWDFSSGSGVDAWFNLATGTAGTTSLGNTASAVSSTITPVGNGWYRCTLTGIPSAATSCTSYELILRLANTNGGNSPNSPIIGNGTYVWQPQIERNATSAGNFVPTTIAIANAGATPIGLLIEEARTNTINNPRCEGAVVGTPGTLPTNWSQTTPSGLAFNVVATGTENGIPYIDLRVVGTATAAITSLMFLPETSSAATIGQTFACSVYVRLLAGSTANITNLGFRIIENNSGGALVGLANITTTMPTNAPLATQRLSTIYTMTGSGAAYIQPGLRLLFNAGAVDATFRIGAPQLERGLFATSVILPAIGTPAATTRAEETALVAGFGSYFQATGGAIATEALWNSVPTINTHMIFQITDSPANNYLQLVNQNGQTSCALASLSSLAGPDLNGDLGAKTITNGTVFKYAVSWNAAGTYTDAASGVQGGTTTVSLPQNLSKLMLGNAVAGNNALGAYVRRFRYWPRFMPTSEVVNNEL